MGEDYKSIYPKVGIVVMVRNGDKVLVGKRKGAHGAGEYAFPGGKLDYMESLTDCAKREIREETGGEIENIKFLRLLNLRDYAPKHFLDVGLTADWKGGEPKVMEPEKCDGWEWHLIGEIPQPIFSGVASMIEAYKTGKNFFDE